MNEYKINMEHLKAMLFDEIMEVYLDEEDSCPNYEWVIAQAVSTVTNIQKHGKIQDDNPFIDTCNPFVEGGEK